MSKKFRLSKILVVLLIGIFLLPSFSGAAVTWVDKTGVWSGTGNGANLAIDATGTVMIAGIKSARLFTSTNSGDSWIERQPAGAADKQWNTVASDADGSFFMAGISGSVPGRLYTSSNGGVNWTERQPAGVADKNWYKVESDSTGTNLMAGQLRLYTSSNGGVNWTERQPAGATNMLWYGLASDSDGSNLMAGALGGRLYISTNGGVNWSETQPAGNADKNWIDLASDSDGTNLLAAVQGGNIYTSTNGGSNWTERIPGGFANETWNSVSFSADGNTILATHTSNVWVSNDGGATWESQASSLATIPWEGSSVSSDGTVLAVIANSSVSSVYVGANVIDSTAPTVSTLSPTDGATAVSLIANLVITFDEAVDAEAGADNNIVIYKASDDSVIETIDAQDAKVTGSGTAIITINPAATLLEQTAYYVQIGADAFDDVAGNSYAGISNTTSWNFTTGDFTNPTVSSFSPLDGATGVARGANLILTFDEAVDVETGNIVIYKASDDSVAETIAVGSANVTGTGTTTITISPSTDIDSNAEYYIQIAATAFDDAASNSYAGIADETTWNFVTASAPAAESGPIITGSGSKKRPVVTVVAPTGGSASVLVCRPGDLFSVTTGMPCASLTASPATIPITCPIISTLRFGSRGEEVKCLQSILQANPVLVIDGIFGIKTKAAVVVFQTLNKLVPDGIVGPLTRAKLGM